MENIGKNRESWAAPHSLKMLHGLGAFSAVGFYIDIRVVSLLSPGQGSVARRNLTKDSAHVITSARKFHKIMYKRKDSLL